MTAKPTCPTCGSDDPRERRVLTNLPPVVPGCATPCPDRFHDAPAPEPGKVRWPDGFPALAPEPERTGETVDAEKALREAHAKHNDCCTVRKSSTDRECVRLTDAINRLARAAWLAGVEAQIVTQRELGEPVSGEPDWLPKEPR